MAEWLQWDVWLAHHGLSAAAWPAPADAAATLAYQRLAGPPPPARRASRPSLDLEAEQALMERILKP
ncbi:MAG TPA: hypothetical protein VGJ54_12265 [Streptosporangiaceae bacterium]|jgi:hypothetical protein